jgi:opacity protein-like surface antigen
MSFERRIGTLMAVASVLALAPRAHAQSETALELYGFGGTTQFLADDPARMVVDLDDSDEDLLVQEGRLDDPAHIGFAVGARLGENWAIEGSFSWAESSLNAVNLEDELDVDLLRYAFGARLGPKAGERLRPFLGAGLGWETFEYALESADPDMHFAAYGMVGIAIRLVSDLSLRLDVREWFSRLYGSDQTSAEWESDLMLSTGLSWGLPLDR